MQQGISSGAQNHFERELLKELPAGFGQGHRKDIYKAQTCTNIHTHTDLRAWSIWVHYGQLDDHPYNWITTLL